MNKITLAMAFVLLAFSNFVQAQDPFVFDFKEGSRGDGTIEFSVFDTELELIGYDGNEVQITPKGYNKPPERAQGLTPLYNTAVDNTNIGLEFKKEGAVVKLTKATRDDVKYTVKVPQKSNIKIEETNWQGDDFNLRGISGSIEINAKGSDMKLKDVSGPLVLSTTNGDINIEFDKVKTDSPSSVTSVNGFIDVTMPAATKANLHMRSTNGEVYTNFDIEFKKGEDGTQMIHGKTIEGTVNGGGVEMSFKAINDDIYLRKK